VHPDRRAYPSQLRPNGENVSNKAVRNETATAPDLYTGVRGTGRKVECNKAVSDFSLRRPAFPVSGRRARHFDAFHTENRCSCFRSGIRDPNPIVGETEGRLR